MIVSATQRSASTIFCAELAKTKNVLFANDAIDGSWKGFTSTKASWHEYTGGLESITFNQVIDVYKNQNNLLILDHSAHYLILSETDIFVSRRNLIGSCASLVKVVLNRNGSYAMALTVLKLNLKRVFDFYTFCQHNDNNIIWTDDLYKFNYHFIHSDISEIINHYIECHNLYHLVATYKLTI